MSEDTKRELHIALELLRNTCVENGVSIAVDKSTGALCFFDTETYVKSKEYKGIRVNLNDLVK